MIYENYHDFKGLVIMIRTSPIKVQCSKLSSLDQANFVGVQLVIRSSYNFFPYKKTIKYSSTQLYSYEIYLIQGEGLHVHG